MLEYLIGSRGLSPAGEAGGDGPRLRIMSAEEFRQAEGYFRQKQMLHSLGSIRYSKGEAFAQGIQGVLRIPPKGETAAAHLALGFYLEPDRLTLIESAGSLKALPGQLKERLGEHTAPDRVLLLFLEITAEDDVLYLQHIEEQMDRLEQAVLDDAPVQVFEALMQCRKRLSELNAHYEQMSALGELMAAAAEDGGRLVRTAAPWQSYVSRMGRLQRYVGLLREYAAQLRDIYQTKQDARQNRTMSILTVVTTLFLPLTLLTGWYGMNFAYMPELRWRYGYAAVAVLAVAVVTAEIIYFKKKKML